MKLAKVVYGYVRFKRSIGFRFREETRTLRSFCRALGDLDVGDVEPNAVLAFLNGSGPITTYWRQKFIILSGFYRFALGRGYVSSSPLPQTLPKFPPAMTPYVYSPEEIKRLVSATGSLRTPMSPLQAETLRTLLLLLCGTGLRIREALSLKLQDVNLEDGLLTVRKTKFFKSRIVPLGPRLTDELRTYATKRHRLPCPSGEGSAFFSTRTGHPLSYERVEKVFQRLRSRAGVYREKAARYQPRIHDFRATFAVHCLLGWYRQGRDVQRLLPHLATYLGHVGIRSTQRYLQLTPELLQEASVRFVTYAREVTHAD